MQAKGVLVAQHPFWRGLPVLAAALLCSPAAFGDDLLNDSVPQKWIDPFLAEKLPDLKYPPYFNDLDKAKAQAFAGRYKLSLQTLAKVKDVAPEHAPLLALVRSGSLLALGR